MAKPANPHDKYFRASMQNTNIAQAFFNQHLPVAIANVLDINSIKLLNNSFIDDSLKESLSDLVFDCRYQDNISQPAQVVLLVEHQSSPDKLMPFRVYHYLFNMLNSWLKHQSKIKRKKIKLPATYALVFYHGKTTPYPYSMKLLDCFDDPYNILKGFLISDVPLVDVHQLDPNSRSQEQAFDIMTLALSKRWERQIQNSLINLAEQLNKLDLTDYITLQFVRSTINYIFGVGDTKSIRAFVEHSANLPQPIRGEIMTGAEYYEELGRNQERLEVAKNLLNAGCDIQFIAKITGLSIPEIKKLAKAQ